MTETADPGTLFRELSHVIKTSELAIGTDTRFDAVATTTAFAASYVELQTGALKNGIVLQHDLAFRPPFAVNPDPASQRVTKYTVCVAPIRPGGASISPCLGFPLHDTVPGAFAEIREAGPYVPGAWQDSDGGLLLSSWPPQTELSQTFSTGTTKSYGTSVGFFGATMQGSESESVSVSWGHSMSIPDVSVNNRSTAHASIIDFVVGEAASPPEFLADNGPPPVKSSQSSFQCQVSELYEFDDRGGDGLRSDDPKLNGQFYAFDIFYYVEFRDYIPDPFPRVLYTPRNSWAWVSERIFVRQPPLPKSA